MQIVQVLQSLQDTVGAKSSVSKEQVSMEILTSNACECRMV